MFRHTRKYMATRVIDTVEGASWFYSKDRRIIFVKGRSKHKAILKVLASKWFDGSYALMPYYDPEQLNF